nr:MAG TPA: hypothetical protein [Siphoviridae sp. ctEup56]
MIIIHLPYFLLYKMIVVDDMPKAYYHILCV